MGKLIVLEGIDGSGKSTQFKKLCERLEKEGVSFTRLTFPRYTQPSSALIRMYLGGEFGDDPEAVNPYAASTFYAVDRYASFLQDWRAAYENGGLVVSDRYTTSNAIHQASKLPAEKRADFFKWLYDFEFDLMGLPKPDAVIYTDVDVDTAVRQMRAREAQNSTKGDIHETDDAYLEKCCTCGRQAADYYGWKKIACVQGGEMRSIESIHEEIYGLVTEALRSKED